MVIELRWFPQSFVQVTANGRTVYFDPALSNTLWDMVRLAFPPHGRNLMLPSGVGRGDLVLVSHAHMDHLATGLVERLAGPEARIIAPESCRKKLGHRMTSVKPGDSLDLDGLVVKVVHAYNPEGSRRTTYHPKGQGVGYVLEIGGKRIYHAGDTGLIEEMRALGPLDVALLPIGGRFTMDVAEAAEAVKLMRPSVVVPMHRLKADPQGLVDRMKEEKGIRIEALTPGGTLRL
ncbi:MAG: MBL fold metallo-hydrolase [Methanomassiliicoccus sp.]|nr:MBL fold metallo-hydrolase [Methanomassiliicoccus sp.]